MIINKNSNPKMDLYYLGAEVIKLLDGSREREFDYFELYHALKTSHKVGIKLFSLVLDWLYISGVIKPSAKGSIEKYF